MRTRVIPGIVVLWVLSGAFARDLDVDRSRLVKEVEPFASEQFLQDLHDPNLLPANGVHQPVFIWNVSSASPRGAVAMLAPTAVRVGRELLVLRNQGIPFTESFTVRRILNATEAWEQFEQSPRHLAGWQAVLKSVDRDSLKRDEPVIIFDQKVLDAFKVSEIVRDTTSPMDNPDPGVLWCCERFSIYSTPHGYECRNAGTSCEVCRSCGHGRPPDPVAPLPTGGMPFLQNSIQPARDND